jgi:hypothetical protein
MLWPRWTPIEPSWTRVADQPSAVRIVTAKPFAATEPANETIPAVGAATVEPDGAPMSMPRCCPPEYGWAASNEKARSTGPSTGQLQACAAFGAARTNRTSPKKKRRTLHLLLLSEWKTEHAG